MGEGTADFIFHPKDCGLCPAGGRVILKQYHEEAGLVVPISHFSKQAEEQISGGQVWSVVDFG